MTTADRFWSKVDASGDCWEWAGGKTSQGYGSYSAWINGTVKTWRAHRFAYEELVGPIPTDLQIDHLCRNRACVNPDHLEPVTAQVNTSRSSHYAGRRTACPKGHPYNETNTYLYPATAARGPRRGCRICTAASNRAWSRRRAVAAA